PPPATTMRNRVMPEGSAARLVFASVPGTVTGYGELRFAQRSAPLGLSPMAEQDAITLVLADDHSVVRSGLRLLLEAEGGFSVLGEAGDVDGAVRAVLGHKPDVLVLDLNMPGSQSSLEAIPRFGEVSPGTRVVVLTMQEDPQFAREALRAGAVGYVLKEAADAELVEAVRRAAAGETY